MAGYRSPLAGGRWHSPKQLDERVREGEKMKAITKTDIKRIRKAIKTAEEGNDYSLIEWAFGEIESVLNKAEKALEKAGN